MGKKRAVKLIAAHSGGRKTQLKVIYPLVSSGEQAETTKGKSATGFN